MVRKTPCHFQCFFKQRLGFLSVSRGVAMLESILYDCPNRDRLNGFKQTLPNLP